jgi:hypothetical protein
MNIHLIIFNGKGCQEKMNRFQRCLYLVGLHFDFAKLTASTVDLFYVRLYLVYQFPGTLQLTIPMIIPY